MTGRLNLFGILAIAIIGANASNFNKPHSHTGKVEPFKPGDPNVKLDGKAKGILKSGKPYQVGLCAFFLNGQLFAVCLNNKSFLVCYSSFSPRSPR